MTQNFWMRPCPPLSSNDQARQIKNNTSAWTRATTIRRATPQSRNMATFLIFVALAKTPPRADIRKANRDAGWWNARCPGCRSAAPYSFAMTRTGSIISDSFSLPVPCCGIAVLIDSAQVERLLR